MATVAIEETAVTPISSDFKEVEEVDQVSSEINEDQSGLTEATESKPWFLKTEDIYEVVKNAAADVRVGDVVLAERAITVVDGFALAITKKVLRVSELEGFSIVQKMDELTVGLLRNVDAGVDVLRIKFVEAVGVLQVAVLQHAEWSSEILKQKAIEARAASGRLLEQLQETEQYKNLKVKLDPAIGTVTTAYGSADTAVRSFLTRMEEDYPDATARIKSVLVLPHPEMLSAASIISGVNDRVVQPAVAGASAVYNVAAPACAAGATTVYNTTVDTAIPACVSGATTVYNTTVDTAIPACVSGANTVVQKATPIVSAMVQSAMPVVSQLMDRAQPYVHRAIETSSPYVEKAVSVTKPAVDVAVSVSKPMIDKVSEVSAPYVTPALENPLVKQTIANSYVAMEAVKSYCTKPQDADAEVIPPAEVADAVVCPSSSGASSSSSPTAESEDRASPKNVPAVASEVAPAGVDEVTATPVGVDDEPGPEPEPAPETTPPEEKKLEPDPVTASDKDDDSSVPGTPASVDMHPSGKPSPASGGGKSKKKGKKNKGHA